jgi:hypothetical protein
MMIALEPSQWTAATDPNASHVEVAGQAFRVQNAAKPWSFTNPGGDNRTLRFELRPGDVWSKVDSPTRERSEIAGTTQFPQGAPIHVSYRFQVEPGAPNRAKWLVIGQFHQGPNDSWSPPFDVELVGEKMSVKINDAGRSANAWSKYRTLYTDRQAIVRGQTYTMQIDARFDLVNGRLRVARDGVTLVDYSGPLGYQGMGSVYWKQGVYRAASNTTIAVGYSNLSITADPH